MPDVSFVDSNVVLYSLAKDDVKQLKALEILASGCVVSTQVLSEVANPKGIDVYGIV